MQCPLERQRCAVRAHQQRRLPRLLGLVCSSVQRGHHTVHLQMPVSRRLQAANCSRWRVGTRGSSGALPEVPCRHTEGSFVGRPA